MPTSQRTIRSLKIHAVLSSAALLALLLIAATPSNPRFAEIDEGEVVKHIAAADATDAPQR